MKAKAAWLIAVLAMVVVFHVLTVKAYPYYVMIKLAISSRSERPVNAIIHRPPTTEKSRLVVRPSPDILYSGCGYDVSKGPLRISARVPDDTYWSMSIFAENTNNFFVINDRQVDSKQVEFILAGKGKKYGIPEGAKKIEAETDQGLIVFRMLVKDESLLSGLIQIQKQADCRPVD